MIYFEEKLNIVPASPETTDSFVSFAKEKLVPCYERLGARLVAAGYSNAEVVYQVMQVWEFDDLAALGAFRARASDDETWIQCQERLEELAPERSTRLMETLGPIPPKTMVEASAQSQESPLGAYSLAILNVNPGMMPQFVAALEEMKALPIVASWRTIVGKHNEVTDVWKGALGQSGYQPAQEGMKQWFRDLRELAPRERLVVVYPLPYSPLR